MNQHPWITGKCLLLDGARGLAERIPLRTLSRGAEFPTLCVAIAGGCKCSGAASPIGLLECSMKQILLQYTAPVGLPVLYTADGPGILTVYLVVILKNI